MSCCCQVTVGGCGIPTAPCEAGKSCISPGFFSSIYDFGYEAVWGLTGPGAKAALIACEQQQLVKAGQCANSAQVQATNDVQATLQKNGTCPCHCKPACWGKKIEDLFSSAESAIITILILAVIALIIWNQWKKSV